MEKAIACNLCKKFKGYGAHCLTGECTVTGKKISLFDYQKEAKVCEHYDSDFKSCCEDCKKLEECKSKSIWTVVCSQKEK